MKGLNQKGSTLAYGLIIIAILSLLGVTILSAALTGYKMRVGSGYNKKAFYIAEAGLEQANAIIEKTMQEAVEYAKNKAKADFDLLLLNERKKQETDRKDNTLSYVQKYKSPYFYHLMSASAGNENTFDFNKNITAEYDMYGNEVNSALTRVKENGEDFLGLDSNSIYDKNAVLGGVVQPYADRKLNELFAKAYVSYLMDSKDILYSTLLEKKLKQVETFQASSHETKNEIVRLTDATVTGFGTLIQADNGLYPQETPENRMVIIFKSIARVMGSSGESQRDKTLETRFEIGIPPYSSPIMKGNEIVKLKANTLFDKALCADKDIIVMGKNVTVNGNIFAKGHDTLSYDNATLGYGGIVVGDALAFKDIVPDITKKEGGLTVNGVISTPSYLQTRNSNSTIIANGNVYCNSLIAQQDWDTDEDGVYSGCNILLKKDINLLDNLNLNCKNTKIEIDGNFFGFSDGSGENALHNQSSSIAINDYDIGTAGNTTSLTINGDGQDTKYAYKDESTGNTLYPTLPKGIYLAGTVYVNYGLEITQYTLPTKGTVSINADGEWTYKPTLSPIADDFTDTFKLKVHNNTFGGENIVTITVNKNVLSGVIASNFQTGDSVSIAGNYMAYSYPLTSDTVSAYTGSDTIYLKYVDLPDECFDSVAPLNLAQRLPIRDADGNIIRSEKMKAIEKSLYARMAREQDRNPLTTHNYFNFGSQKVFLKPENMKYSLGNFIENVGATSDFQAMKDHSPSDSEHGYLGVAGLAAYGDELYLKAKEFSYYTKKMADPQIENYMGKNPDSIGLNLQNTIADYFDFPLSGSNNLADRKANSNDPIYYVSGDTSTKPLIITGENSKIPSGVLSFSYDEAKVVTNANEFVDGVIVTAGDIYISGKLNYKGIIATKGNIYIFDDEEKTFTNDYNPKLLVFNSETATSNDYSHMIENISNNTVIKKILEDQLTPLSQIGDMFKQDPDWKKEITFTKDVDNNVVADGVVNTYTSRLSSFIKVNQWRRDN